MSSYNRSPIIVQKNGISIRENFEKVNGFSLMWENAESTFTNDNGWECGLF